MVNWFSAFKINLTPKKCKANIIGHKINFSNFDSVKIALQVTDTQLLRKSIRARRKDRDKSIYTLQSTESRDHVKFARTKTRCRDIILSARGKQGEVNTTTTHTLKDRRGSKSMWAKLSHHSGRELKQCICKHSLTSSFLIWMPFLSFFLPHWTG